MSDTAQRMVEKRANVWEQAKELLDRAYTENRDLTSEEETVYQRMSAEIDALDARVKTIAEQEKRAKDAEQAFNDIYSRKQERNAPATPAERGFAAEMRAFASGESQTLDLPFETRDILKSGSGANLVPTTLSSRMWEYMVENSAILGAGVNLINTASGEEIKLPKATVHPSAASATEGAAITESDPTFTQASLTVSKNAFVTEVSREMIDDSGVNLVDYLSRAAARELGNKVGGNAVSVLLAGVTPSVTGPTGVTGGFGVQSTAGRGFDLLYDLFYSVISPYRGSASCGWLMSDPTAAAVRKIKSADGVYAWQASTQAGQPDLILGKSVYVDTNVPDVALDAESVLFGDLYSLAVRIAGGFRFERDDSVGFKSDLVTFRAVVRHGAVHLDPNAVKSFVGAAS